MTRYSQTLVGVAVACFSGACGTLPTINCREHQSSDAFLSSQIRDADPRDPRVLRPRESERERERERELPSAWFYCLVNFKSQLCTALGAAHVREGNSVCNVEALQTLQGVALLPRVAPHRDLEHLRKSMGNPCS